MAAEASPSADMVGMASVIEVLPRYLGIHLESVVDAPLAEVTAVHRSAGQQIVQGDELVRVTANATQYTVSAPAGGWIMDIMALGAIVHPCSLLVCMEVHDSP
jgi:acetyl/propionyl-CoA carboxylase alpha subunit